MRKTFLALLVALPLFAEGELRFSLRADPKTFDPLLVEDDNSEIVRYITGGVLIRVHRGTQQITPEVADSWKIDQDGRRITFHIRPGLKFSDGADCTADDVVFTLKRLLDPKLHSPAADPFKSSSTPPKVTVSSGAVTIVFGAPVSGLERLFDDVAIQRANSKATLGPFYVADYKPGVEVTLARNPYYWKTDAAGRRLPYLDRIHLQIQQNRDLELVRFRRGEVDLINTLEPDSFDLLPKGSVVDAGASLESEMMWFNQSPSAPLPAYKKAWFASTEFRRSVSEAINREDLCKVVYRGHARPAEGPISPANRFWFNSSLKPHPHDVASARKRLESAGFRLVGDQLYDTRGYAVVFSVVTNAGNKSREKMAAMIQQDLHAIGIRVNVVTLDFPSLIDRMTQSFNYEACLLGLTNLDLDPSAQMNVWLSSAGEHQWNPSQKTPATAWEAEIDRLMQAQAAELKPERRKALFDRVQQIVWEQEPFLYLINKNSLMAFSPKLHNTAPATVQPQAFWNIEVLRASER